MIGMKFVSFVGVDFGLSVLFCMVGVFVWWFKMIWIVWIMIICIEFEFY